jgi:hypothetical protein
LDRETHRWANRFTFIIVAASFLGVTATVALLVARSPDSGSVKPGGTQPVWTEVKWPFPIDQWGTGRAFRCGADKCGIEVEVYLRPKIGFCNCTTGVSDDTELDRVGDLELFSEKFHGLADGRPITVGWMNGRSRAYNVAIPYAQPRDVLAVAFNDQCNVMVATVVAEHVQIAQAEHVALEFLNGQLVLHWAKAELGS